MPALRAGGGSRPRPLGASLPPPAASGPLPLPTLGGLGAARPARLRRSGICGGWSPPAAAQVCAPAGLASRQPLRGATQSGRKAKPPAGAAGAGLAPRQPRAGCGVGAPGRPAPTRGGFGAVRPSGPGVPGSGQPPRGGSAYARPARRSGPAPLRRPAAEPRGGVRAPAGRGPCAAAIFTPRARALPALRVAALSRASRAAGARGYAACGRDGHTGEHPARPRQAACGGPCLMISGVAKGDKVTRPPVAGHQRPKTHREKGCKKMMMSIEVPNVQAALEIENALLLNLMDIQRQLAALDGKNTAYAIHRREILRQRYNLCEAWKQSVVRQSQSLIDV